VIAFGAFEQPVLEANWPPGNALQYHPCLAARTTRPLDSGQELLGRGHDASLHLGGSVTELSVTDRYRDRAVLGPSMQPFEGTPLVNIAHF
jgi:hypothetical protein